RHRSSTPPHSLLLLPAATAPPRPRRSHCRVLLLPHRRVLLLPHPHRRGRPLRSRLLLPAAAAPPHPRRSSAGAPPDSYSEPPPEQASAPHQTSIAISLAQCKASDFSDQRLIAKWSDPAAPLPRPPPRDRVDLAAPPPRPSTLSPSAMSPQQAPLLCSPPGPLTARSQSTPPCSRCTVPLRSFAAEANAQVARPPPSSTPYCGP
ncbi:Os07g0684700, partial [Oryza sativa Japonica Group]